MFQENKFDTGEVVLNYAEGPPNGPPLILIHGLPGRWQEFLPIMDDLSCRWQVFALDLRGQGLSGHGAIRYLPAVYTADLVAFIQGRVREPVVIFGMSAGGLTALHAASITPDQVLALVIGDSPVDLQALAAWMNSAPFAAHFTEVKGLIGQKLSLAELAQALGEMPVHLSGMAEPPQHREVKDQAALDEWAATIHTMDPEVLRYHAAGRGDDFLYGLDMDAALSQVTCPTLLIRGDQKLGALLSAEASEYAASLLAQAEIRLIENMGHSLGMEGDAGPLLEVVKNFLETIHNE
jgi:pimeloyl-ACP methyl ester carboxylesterase